jgi:muramoyltetrapeptide carboxypeptidase
MKIGIFAGSAPILGEIKQDLYKVLEDLGIEVFEHPQCKLNYNGYLAGTVEQRVTAIHELFLDKTVDVIMAFWGGQNTNEILPLLNYELIDKNIKPIIGYSDTTCLLLALYAKTHCPTFIGCAGISFTKPEPISYTIDRFKEIFIDKKKLIIIKDSDQYADDYYFLKKNPLNQIREKKNNEGRKVFRHGIARGVAIGANIQTLLLLAGTKFFPNLDNTILFLEEAEECSSPAVLHRFLTHLSQVVDFNKIAGICFGRFTAHSNIKNEEQLRQIINDVFGNFTMPILFNLDFGHSDPSFIVPNGSKCLLDTRKNIIQFKL